MRPKLLVQQLVAEESQPLASDGRRVCWFEAAVAGTAVEQLGVEAELAEVERTGVAVAAAV